MSVLLGNGNGTFAAKCRLPDRHGPYGVLGDLNGDGRPDLAVGEQHQQHRERAVRQRQWHVRRQADYAVGPCSVAIADLNGDGSPDLAVANRNSSTVSVLFNNGNGTFAAKVDYPGTFPFSVAVVD